MSTMTLSSETSRTDQSWNGVQKQFEAQDGAVTFNLYLSRQITSIFFTTAARGNGDRTKSIYDPL